MQRAFKKDFTSLNKIFDFLDGFIVSHRVNESIAFSVKFAVEEVFTNMVKYNPAGKDDVVINLDIDGKAMTISLLDSEEKPFDLTKAEPANVNLPLEERKPGGLGIHLTKKLMDKVDYEHKDKKSKITLVKYLE